jgi:hypothetical protein
MSQRRAVVTPLFDAVTPSGSGPVAAAVRRGARAAGAGRILDWAAEPVRWRLSSPGELPATRAIGIDGDQRCCVVWRAKATAVGVALELHEALADTIRLPIKALTTFSAHWSPRPPANRKAGRAE